MSAYICETHLFHYLTQAFFSYAKAAGTHEFTKPHRLIPPRLDRENDVEGSRRRWMIAELYLENHKSVSHRYKDSDAPCMEAILISEYSWQCFHPHQVIRTIQCYQYQSSDHSEWKESKAKQITDTLKEMAIEAILNGFGQSLRWGAPRPEKSITYWAT